MVENSPDPPVPLDSRLTGVWIVDAIGELDTIPDGQPTVHFSSDGSVSGSTGVNRFAGRFELLDGELRTSPLATTRMAGPPELMDQEARLLEALATPGAVRAVDRDDIGIGIVVGDGTTVLHLVRDEGVDAPE